VYSHKPLLPSSQLVTPLPPRDLAIAGAPPRLASDPDGVVASEADEDVVRKDEPGSGMMSCTCELLVLRGGFRLVDLEAVKSDIEAVASASMYESAEIDMDWLPGLARRTLSIALMWPIGKLSEEYVNRPVPSTLDPPSVELSHPSSRSRSPLESERSSVREPMVLDDSVLSSSSTGKPSVCETSMNESPRLSSSVSGSGFVIGGGARGDIGGDDLALLLRDERGEDGDEDGGGRGSRGGRMIWVSVSFT